MVTINGPSFSFLRAAPPREEVALVEGDVGARQEVGLGKKSWLSSLLVDPLYLFLKRNGLSDRFLVFIGYV